MSTERESATGYFTDAFKKQMADGKIDTPSTIFPERDENLDEQMLYWARYIYGLYSAGLTVISPYGYYNGGDTTIAALRSYARGKQPTSKYRQILDVQLKDTANFDVNQIGNDHDARSVLNISWKNVAVWPAIRERIIDRILGIQFVPNVTAVDESAAEQKKNTYMRDRLAAMPQSKEMFAQVGMAPTNITENADNLSPEDIDTIFALGGYSVAAEIEYAEAIEFTMNFSRSEVIKRQLIEDLIDIGVAAEEVVTDEMGRQYVEYIDPARLIFRTSVYSDCRDSDFCAYVRDLNLAKLRAESGFSEKVLYEIANTYRAVPANRGYRMPDSPFNNGQRELFTSRFRTTGALDNMRIQVMRAYVVGLDVERYVAGIGARGGRIFDRVNRDSVLNKKNVQAGKTIEDIPIQYIYSVNWVVGTNYVYGVKREPLTSRDGIPGSMRAVLPVNIYALNSPSLGDSVTPIIDDLQIAVLRKRSLMSKMPPPPNVAIDLSMIEDAIMLGKMEVGVSDLLDLYSARGYFMYSRKDEFGNVVNNGSPISPLPDTTFQYMQTIQLEIENCVRMLSMVTGVSEIMDSAKNVSGVLNGVAANLETTSNRSLSGLYTAYRSLMQNLCIQACKRYQISSANKEIKFSTLRNGSRTVQTIRLIPQYSIHDFEVTVTPYMDDAVKQQLMSSLMQNRQQQMITESDYFAVVNMIDRNQMEMAQFYLARAVERKRVLDEQSRQQAMQVQSASQAQAGAAVEQAKGQTELAKMQAESQLEILKGKIAADQAKADFENQKQLLILQYQLKSEYEEKEEEEPDEVQVNVQ